MALERKRISKRGIPSYMWCGKKEPALVFPLSGDLYLARLSAAAPEVVRLTNDEDVPEMDPVCDDQGALIAVVKKGDVVVIDIKTRKARALTRGARPTRTFGLAEFIAAEEMGRNEGMWWSTDSKRMIVSRSTRRGGRQDERASLPTARWIALPAAGEKNAVVTPWLVDVATGKKLWYRAPTVTRRAPASSRWRPFSGRAAIRPCCSARGQREGRSAPHPRRDPTWVELHTTSRCATTGVCCGRPRRAVGRSATAAPPHVLERAQAVDAINGVDEDRAWCSSRRAAIAPPAPCSCNRSPAAPPWLTKGPRRCLRRHRALLRAHRSDGKPPTVDVRDVGGKPCRCSTLPGHRADVDDALGPQWIDRGGGRRAERGAVAADAHAAWREVPGAAVYAASGSTRGASGRAT